MLNHSSGPYICVRGEKSGQSKLITETMPVSALAMGVCADTVAMREDHLPVWTMRLNAQSVRYADHCGPMQ